MKLFVAGDLYLGGRVGRCLDEGPERLFGGSLQWIRTADVALVNLEAPLCIGGSPIRKTGPCMRAEPAGARFLKEAGIGLVTLANNHIYDYGAEGLRETFTHLDAVGLPYVGAGENLASARKSFVYRANGVSVGILNFAENEWSTTPGERPGANPMDPVSNYYDIRALKETVDYVIVISHGGHETYGLPSPEMKKRFHFFVDAGADAVLNHHQHVVSGVERYKGAPICYGLGNFLFDNGDETNSPWNRGLAVTLALGDGHVETEWHFFDQCASGVGISVCSESEHKARLKEMQELSELILDDGLLESEFQRFLSEQGKRYRSYLFPSGNRVLQFLYSRGLFPSLLSKRKKRLYLNLIRCESHREALVKVMEKDI